MLDDRDALSPDNGTDGRLIFAEIATAIMEGGYFMKDKFKLLAFIGMLLGGAGTLLSAWADDKELDKKIDERLEEKLKSEEEENEES